MAGHLHSTEEAGGRGQWAAGGGEGTWWQQRPQTHLQALEASVDIWGPWIRAFYCLPCTAQAEVEASWLIRCCLLLLLFLSRSVS
jgi:hypothetical protein